MAIDVFIRAIADESEPLSEAPFHEASDPSPSEVIDFDQFLSTLDEEERRVVLTTMVEQAEENLELDFTSIFRHFLSDEDDRLVQLGIEGLWEQEERWLVTELVGLLRSERGAQVRAASAVALGKFPILALEGKIPPQEGALIYRVLMDFLEDEIEDLEVRRRCLEALAPYNTEEVRDYIRWAYDDEDQDLRSSSIYAMGRTGELSWLPVLLLELESSDAAVRYETANACGELADQQATPQLVELLDDEDPEVRLGSIAALGKIGGAEARRALIDCVQDGDAAMSEAAHAELENLQFLDDPMRLLPGDT